MPDGPGVNAGASSAHPADAAGVCVSCGTPLVGEYCHACGEQDARARTLTLRSFLHESFHSATNLEGKGFRSFRLLLSRPGLLTREYVRGRRSIYLLPIQLFLIANLVFFVTLSFTDVRGLTTPLRMQLYDQVYSGAARAAVRDRFLEMDSVAFQRFETRFDQASETHAKSLVILLVPLFAALLWLTRFWRREGAVQHIVFSTHFMAMLMLLLVLMGGYTRAVRLLPSKWLPWVLSENLVTVGLLLLCAAYLYPALRTAYGDTRPAAIARAGFLGAATLALIMLYRFILFFTVLYTI